MASEKITAIIDSLAVLTAGAAGAAALGAAAGAGAAGLDLLLRTDPMTVVRTMMQIRPKNTVPIPMRVTKSGLYIDSSYPFR